MNCLPVSLPDSLGEEHHTRRASWIPSLLVVVSSHHSISVFSSPNITWGTNQGVVSSPWSSAMNKKLTTLEICVLSPY